MLAKIQLGDSRTVDVLVLNEWVDSIGFLPFQDTIAAVTLHRRESTDYLLPAHLIRNVKRIQERRALESGVRECPSHPGYPVPCARCIRDAEEGVA